MINEKIYKSEWFGNLSKAKQELLILIIEGNVDDEFLKRIHSALEDHLSSKKKVIIEIDNYKLQYKVCDLNEVLVERLGD